MSFTFNFSGDDIDPAGGDVADYDTAAGGRGVEDIASTRNGAEEDQLLGVRARTWGLDELLQSLPSQISYTTTLLTSPQRGRQTLIPRRALFDIKMQIMAESDEHQGKEHQRDGLHEIHASGERMDQNNARKTNNGLGGLPPGLSTTDIEKDVYEGGFKTWEGGLDLARLLLDRGPRKDIDEMSKVGGIVELGAGTATPTLTLFQHALRSPPPASQTFVCTDYNDDVLRLATLPNLLLVWCLEKHQGAFDGDALPRIMNPDGGGSGKPNNEAQVQVENAEGELNITPHLIQAFKTNLHDDYDITLSFISGAWQDPKLPQHILSALDSVIPHEAAQAALATHATSTSTSTFSTSNLPSASYPNPTTASTSTSTSPEKHTLILSSEVLYSPLSLPSFSNILSTLLKATQKNGKAYVSGKRYYFGVGAGLGGGWDGFKRLMGGLGCGVCEVRGWDGWGGVGEGEADDGGGGGDSKDGNGKGGVGVERGILEVQMF